MGDYTLRLARLSDAVRLAECIDDAYAGYAAEGIDLPPVSQGVADDIRDNIVWLAVEGDDILGGVILSVSGEVAHLLNVAVDPQQSGRGIGRALIGLACRSAQEAGHTKINLTTHKDMPGNVALYQRLGWEVIRHEGDSVFMTFALTAST